MTDRTPLLRVSPDEVARLALVVGDPARAERVAARLDDARQVGSFREFVTFTGAHRGTPVTVSSHGVGAAGAALCFEELHQAGVRRMIRAGTCGGLRPEIGDGDLIVATGAVRDDGFTDRLVPPAFPALASVDVVTSLRRTLAEAGHRGHEGVVLTSAVFYSHDVLGSSLEQWARAGAVAVEMECAALFVIGALRDMEVGALLAVDGNPLHRAEGGYDPHRGVVRDAVDVMVGFALDALVA
ncbi:MAG TPA: nucleoside phosphorylase [Acidimicrobiia bacterium]|nr:nucleoside phosphorylase [Acidimicrobiia bacterium]